MPAVRVTILTDHTQHKQTKGNSLKDPSIYEGLKFLTKEPNNSNKKCEVLFKKIPNLCKAKYTR